MTCVFECVHGTDLQSAVQEAAVLSRLVAQAFAGCDGVHVPGGHQPMQPPRCRSTHTAATATAARRKVVPLPRHHYLDAPDRTREERGGAADRATDSMSLPSERTSENGGKRKVTEGIQRGRGERERRQIKEVL